MAADPSTIVPEQLVAKADRVVRAALREGITGPDTERLLEWVTRHRVQQRRRKARVNVTAVLDEIQQAEGVA